MKKKLMSAVLAALVMVTLPTQAFAAEKTVEKEASEVTIVDESREAAPDWFNPVVGESNGYDTLRLAGSDRFATGLMCAETIRELRGVEKFSKIVIASGTNFPDALAGASLAGESYGTPIILVGQSDTTNQQVYDYINNYVKKDATIYVLGGEAAVPASVVSNLSANGFTNVKRLAGNDRYETNLAIINEMDTRYVSRVVIATGKNFADSLAISSYAYSQEWPIMLVGDSMTEAQMAKLREIDPTRITIVGGTSAVSTTVENQAKEIVGSYYVYRYAGTDRYDTAMKIADDWCYVAGEYAGDPTAYDEFAILAYGQNFPDALAGSALAGYIDAPIILVDSDSSRQAAFLRTNTQVENLITVGGTSVIPDSIVSQFSK